MVDDALPFEPQVGRDQAQPPQSQPVSALDRVLWVTTFPNAAATTKQSAMLSLRDLIPRLRDTVAASKDCLPFIKLASFGGRHTSKNSLRFDANVHEVYGVELDYDAQRLTPEKIAAALLQHNLAGLVVTSPSHTDEAPRARILMPLSTPLKPAARAQMVSRAAGIIPDEVAPESWTLSQCYYCGRVGDAPQHRVIAVDGDFVDARDDLDATAKPRPKPAKPRRQGKSNGAAGGNGVDHPDPTQLDLFGQDLPVDVVAALNAIAEGDDSHDALVRLAGRWAAHGLPRADIQACLASAFHRRPEDRRDSAWQKALDDLPRLVAWAHEREDEAAATAAAGAATPPPQPPPGSGASAAAPGVSPPPQPQAATAAPPLPLLTRRNSKFLGNVENVMTLLRQRPELAGCFGFDLMARTVVVRQPLPWSHHFTGQRAATDADYTNLQGFLQRHAGLGRLGKDTTHQAADSVALENQFHPVRDYLRATTWDRTERLDTWLSEYTGAEQSDYTYRIGRMFMIGMVARVERPGCKMDYVLVLEGPQGILKSQLLRELGGPWFSDQLPDIHHGGKEASQHLRGLWLIELAELDAMTRADVLQFNGFVTRAVEIYRPAYGRKEVTEPRQCVFAGTTNRKTYLRDATGARRFWVVKTEAVRPAGLRLVRDQLFAEALVAFQAGEHWWPDAEFEAKSISPEQDQRFVGDVWEDPVRDYLARLRPPTVGDPQVTATVLGVAQGALALETGRISPNDQHRITAIMQRLGWQPRRNAIGRWWETTKRVP